jgi:hypothetical protein
VRGIFILADTTVQDAESAGQIGHARKPIEDGESRQYVAGLLNVAV